MIAIFRLTLIPALLLTLVGCADKPTVRELSLKDGDRYLSPGGRFSVLVPTLVRPGERQMQRSTNESTTVVFEDRFGTLLSIQSTELDDAQLKLLTGADRRDQLQQVFEHTVLQEQINKSFTGATVKVQDYPYISVGRAWFATVLIPGGSTLVDPEHREKKLDALRAYLVFTAKDSLYIVATQEIPLSPGRPETLSDQARADRLLGRLEDIVGGMVFN